MQKIYILILSSIHLISFADSGIAFKENKNQWPSNVLFGANYRTTKFFVNNNGFNFCVYDGKDINKAHQVRHDKINENNAIDNQLVKGHNYNVIFNNASFLNVSKFSPLTEYYNYFIGNDESKWAGNVRAFEELLFSNIYSDIDLKLYSNKNDIKYDIIVKPHGNIYQVELNYRNVNHLSIKDGSLIVETSIGNIIEQKPYAYQFIKGKKTQVACQYVLKNNNVTYSLPNGYNDNYELVIDPTIVVCSYDNSPVWSNCHGASYDVFGNIFVLGQADAGYPTTTGAFQILSDSLYDNIVSKYNPTGNIKIFTTYVGGDNYEFIQNTVVTNNEINVFGTTYSSNFPTSINAFDKTFNDTLPNFCDFFVCKLDLTGSSLLASTYIGGLGNDGINSVVVATEGSHIGNMLLDPQGNVYVIGSTNSTDFPTSSGAFQAIKNSGVDNIAFKLDPNLQTLLYSTFFGGTNNENAYGSKLINSNELLICGSTQSADFPSTAGTINPIKNAGRDMYVFHLNSSGTGMIASTFLGTPTNEYAYFIDTDDNNDIYVCGYMGSTPSFTPTPGLYSTVTGRSTIYKINSSLSSIIYKTRFGSANFLEYTAFKIDSCQNIYIAAITSGITFPVTADKFQSHNQGSDLYITVFNTNMLSLKFASYFGGRNDEHVDGGTSYFSDKGVLYQGICINRGNLPTTTGAYQSTFPTIDTMAYNDAFVKIDLQNFVTTTSSYGAEIKGCPSFTANFNSFTNTGTNSWDFGDGSPISYQQNTTHVFNSVGNYTVYLVANDSTTCNKTDTVKSIVKIINPSQLNITGNTIICKNQSIILKAETTDPVSFSWSTGATTNTVSIQAEGSYTATINNGGCNTQQTIDIKHSETNIDELFPNVITPNNDNANDVIDLNKYGFTTVSFSVFDRWGIEKYKTDKIDAIFNPASYTDGTYFYTLDYKTACNDSQIKTKGFITVFK